MTKNKIMIAGNNNAGLCYFRLTMFEEALECFNNTLKLDPKNKEAINNKGILFFEKNEYLIAVNYFDQVIKINPNDSTAWTNKGMVYNALRKFEFAIECFDKSLEINPSYTDAFAHKSFALYSLEKYNEVITLSELFIEASPLHLKISKKQATMYFHLAVAHARLAKTNIEHKDALKYYDRYLMIIPHDPIALRGKADILNVLEQFESALYTYNECLKYNSNPYDAEILSNKAGIFIKLKKPVKAIIHSWFAIKINTRHMGAYYNLGKFLFDNGDLESAMMIFEEAGEIELPDYFYEEENFEKMRYFDDLKYQGLGLFHIKEYLKALERFDKILVHTQGNIEILSLKGESLEKLGNFEGAISAYENILYLEPENKFALAHKGECLAHMNKDSEAITIYNKFLEKYPDDPTVLMNKGVALSNKGEHRKALLCFDRTLEKHPIDKYALYGKGQTLNRLRRFDEALDVFDEAIEIEPEFYGTYIEKGNSLVKLQRPEEAIDCYLKSFRLEPNYYQTLRNLSDTYNLIGDTTNGKKYLKEYLRLERIHSRFYFSLHGGYPVFKK